MNSKHKTTILFSILTVLSIFPSNICSQNIRHTRNYFRQIGWRYISIYDRARRINHVSACMYSTNTETLVNPSGEVRGELCVHSINGQRRITLKIIENNRFPVYLRDNGFIEASFSNNNPQRYNSQTYTSFLSLVDSGNDTFIVNMQRHNNVSVEMVAISGVSVFLFNQLSRIEWNRIR